MASSADTLRQRLPAQDLHRLSLVSHHPKKLTEWVDALPMINVGETSRQVFQTLQEIGRLNITPQERFELLEILRPTAHALNNALAKHYLNQSIMLPERATKVATLAQAMQNHLANGYKLVALELEPKIEQHKRDAELPKLLAQTLHRAITELTGNLLRSTQLYLNTPPKLWLELHALYLMSVSHNLSTQLKIADHVGHPGSEKTTITNAYTRALLLATCKPNKLRQGEIAQVYQLSEAWSPLITLKEFNSHAELFVFDLSKDAPPTYRNVAQAADAAHVRAIDGAALVLRLNELKQAAQNPPPGARGEAALSFAMLQHLIKAWSELSERSFSRTPHEGILKASLGLTPTHYFLSDGRDFDTVIQGNKPRALVMENDNPFLKGKPVTVHRPDERTGKDVWSLAFGDSDTEAKERELSLKLQAPVADTSPRYETHDCNIVNISPGGYCIEWSGDVPTGVRAGEVLGLHEEGGQPGWSVGVIRWVKQLPGHGAQLGIEILAPKAKPCGARVLKKTGEASEYMRTLLLPELKAIGRPATLITPALTFRSGYKIALNLDGEEVKANLTEQVSATSSFCQFEFQLVRHPKDAGDNTPLIAEADTTSIGRDNDDFDSIWDSL